MRLRHLIERRYVLLVLVLLVKVHCLRLMHSLLWLLRRMVHRYRGHVLRSAGRRSLDGGRLLLLRVSPSKLVTRWLWLLTLRLTGSALLVWCSAILLSFLDHGSYHCSRDAELVAVAVEDHVSA